MKLWLKFLLAVLGELTSRRGMLQHIKIIMYSLQPTCLQGLQDSEILFGLSLANSLYNSNWIGFISPKT